MMQKTLEMRQRCGSIEEWDISYIDDFSSLFDQRYHNGATYFNAQIEVVGIHYRLPQWVTCLIKKWDA